MIERKNAKEINVSMTPNNTGLERTLTVSLQAGNYFDGFNMHQTITNLKQLQTNHFEIIKIDKRSINIFVNYMTLFLC
ncbi:hypothetical protein [Maribacter sp. Asnod2-G09]|uniref:hypothetical protein n=1 Tax=Maribacter sp. Asnod2-G09 TaxID=3160577 RepID=UPI0038675074